MIIIHYHIKYIMFIITYIIIINICIYDNYRASWKPVGGSPPPPRKKTKNTIGYPPKILPSKVPLFMHNDLQQSAPQKSTRPPPPPPKKKRKPPGSPELIELISVSGICPVCLLGANQEEQGESINDASLWWSTGVRDGRERWASCQQGVNSHTDMGHPHHHSYTTTATLNIED